MTKRRILQVDDIVQNIVEHTGKTIPVENENRLWVSSGSTLLNLVLSDKVAGGFQVGKIANIIGDSSSGKSFLCLTILAEAANDPVFDDYRLIYDDAEAAREFNMRSLFGEKAYTRIEAPRNDKNGMPVHSQEMLDFQVNIRSLFADGKPFIYVLDSFDALSSKEEREKATEQEKAHLAEKEIKGSYGMEKAKQASVLLRLLAADLKKTNSLLLIISQTRDNIDPMSFVRKTRAGGRALSFYATYELWLAVAGKLTVTINGRKRAQGMESRIRVTKNKTIGKAHEIDLPIYYSYGIDDLGSCIDWLCSEGLWKKSPSGMINAPELKLNASRTKLIREIEQGHLLDRVKRSVEKAWLDIEKKLRLERSSKYE